MSVDIESEQRPPVDVETTAGKRSDITVEERMSKKKAAPLNGSTKDKISFSFNESIEQK